MFRCSVIVAVGAVLVAASCAGDSSEPEPAATAGSASTMTDSTLVAISESTVVTATGPEPDVAASSDTTVTSPVISSVTTPATTLPVAEFDFAEASAIVGDFVVERGLNGAGLAIVHRDHGLIHHEHWGDFDEDRVSLVASSSKMISAGVLLALQDQGLLDLDAPVADVVPWGTAHPDITPAQLLSNSSGLVGLIAGFGYVPYFCQILATSELEMCAEQIFSTSDDDAETIPPDTEFRYGGAQWQVAGAVAQAASGQTWQELIDETFNEPCGLTSLGYNNHFLQPAAGIALGYPSRVDGDVAALAATDNPNIEAGAYITSGDYAELMLMILRGGRCGDRQVLSEAAVAEMLDDRVLAAYGGDAEVPGRGYGLGWWVDRASGRRIDSGLYGSEPWLDLEDGYGVYLVIEEDGAAGSELAGRLYEVIDEAVNAS